MDDGAYGKYHRQNLVGKCLRDFSDERVGIGFFFLADQGDDRSPFFDHCLLLSGRDDAAIFGGKVISQNHTRILTRICFGFFTRLIYDQVGSGNTVRIIQLSNFQ